MVQQMCTCKKYTPCQKQTNKQTQVENLVVGAPCGVMDQMTSVLGEQHKLLALLCQPAEIQGQVSLPGHLQVWGLDSGRGWGVGVVGVVMM